MLQLNWVVGVTTSLRLDWLRADWRLVNDWKGILAHWLLRN
jgi:hypothetical protein